MLSLALTLAAVATPVAPEVVWRAPPGCPTEAAVRDRVASLLAGTDGMAGAAVELTVEARVDGRWRLHAVWHGRTGEGERVLDADDCDALAEAAALLTAIAAQPSLAGVVPPPPPVADRSLAEAPPPRPAAAVPPPGDVPAKESAPLPPPPSTTRPRARWGLLALGGGVAVGVLTTPMAVLRAAGGVRGQRWSVALTQTFWLPRDMPSAEASDIGGRMWLWAAGLRGCGIPVDGRVEVDLCAAVEAGAVTGRGIGALTQSVRQTSAWLALSGGPAAGFQLGARLRLTLGVDLLVVAVRPHFSVIGGGEVCCGARIGGRALLGVELRLP
jgi:hypothetical protein